MICLRVLGFSFGASGKSLSDISFSLLSKLKWKLIYSILFVYHYLIFFNIISLHYIKTIVFIR